MTILEISNKLIDFFRTNDKFELDKDWKKIIPISENEKLDLKLVRHALDKLETIHNLVSRFVIGDYPKNDTIYVLQKPLSHYNQQIELTPETVFAIADILQLTSQHVNIMNINERDIQNLCTIIYNALNKENTT